MGLLKSIPRLDIEENEKLVPIPGSPPDLLKPPAGCPFASRCPYTMKICLDEFPEYTHEQNGHRSACWLNHPDAPKIEVSTGVRREAK
jgi:oligopeptide transport system ATP-binding protein